MKRRSLAILLLLVVTLILTTSYDPVHGGELTADLQAGLAQANSNDYVSVLVFLYDQVDAPQLTAALKARSFSRQAWHKLALQKLQQTAEVSQQAIRAALDQGIADGAVASYETYWIADAIRVDAVPSFVEQLAQRSDVEVIMENKPPEALWSPNRNPQPEAAGVTDAAGASDGVRAIGADVLWAQGITGEGVLVGTMDTGVEGDHPALHDSYRGNNGYSARESWFDPVYHEDYPYWDSSIPHQPYWHGTETMGVLVGKNDATGDTTGVAFDAQWISAMVVDVPGANYLQAFQWFADPDGDPNTVDDVPDVLSNSWGFQQYDLGCLDVFWTAIDNLEALGTVVVFACGNEGPTSRSLRNPANRATTPYNTFSVGALDPHQSNYPIWPGSSRGPSDCDGISIKPEVAAPGYDVRTTYVNGQYTFATGTSFAAPSVAGAVALLRQVNPNASVDTIKWALMESATDLGDPGEDNTYGHGIINLPAAKALLPANESINIYLGSVHPDSVVADTTVDVVLELKNSGIGTVDLWAKIVDADERITVVQDSAFFGDLGGDESIDNSTMPFVLQFAEDIPEGSLLPIDLQIGAADGGYEKTIKVYFLIGTPLVRSSFTHYSDSLAFTISNYGTYGLAENSASPDGGVGFIYHYTGLNTDTNNLYQCGLLIASDSEHVSDGISNLTYSVDIDFNVAPEGNLTKVAPGVIGDTETVSRFQDTGAAHPLGVVVDQRSAACQSGVCADYVILEYAISNPTVETLSNIWVGLYFDWDFPAEEGSQGTHDRSGYDPSHNLGYMWSSDSSQYRGCTVLSDPGMTGFFGIWNALWIYDGISEAEKYHFLSSGLIDSTGTLDHDRSFAISTGPFELAPNESQTVAFAVLASKSLTQLEDEARNARDFYRAATPVTDYDEIALPTEYALDQNYPNPFNPATNISFSLPRPGRVSIDIFNLLGQRVITLLDQDLRAGTHQIRWEGVDAAGQPAASGVYLYRLQAGDFSATRKMLLLK